MDKNKGGRPYKHIDQKQFESMCQIMCTQAEMCAVLDVDEETLNSWCKRTYKAGFSEVYKKKIATGKMSLRHKLFLKATQGGKDGMGETPTQIFLAKNYLGMSDSPSIAEEIKQGIMPDLLAAINNHKENGET